MVAIDKALLVCSRRVFLETPFDLLTDKIVLDMLRTSPPERAFRYVVTPNVDYVVRLRTDSDLRHYVRDAWLSVCDSRPICLLARMLFIKLPLVTGSDLTIELFRSVIEEGDRITLVAPNSDVVERLRSSFPHVDLRAIVPPAGLRDNPEAMKACVDFVAAQSSRFVFLAVGSPQSDVIAYQLAHHPQACGIGLSIGASLEFLVGTKRRAPRWVQRMGLEWLHRVLSEPRRLWRRYAYSVVPLIKLFSHEVVARPFRHG